MADRTFSRPNQGEGFKLGLQLAQSCRELHSGQWLHKKSRTQNILFFPKEEQRSLQIPIPGWVFLAGEDARTGARQATESILSNDSDLCVLLSSQETVGSQDMKICLIITLSAMYEYCTYLLLEIGLLDSAKKALFENEKGIAASSIGKKRKKKLCKPNARWKRHLIRIGSFGLGKKSREAIFRDMVLTLLRKNGRPGKARLNRKPISMYDIRVWMRSYWNGAWLFNCTYIHVCVLNPHVLH